MANGEFLGIGFEVDGGSSIDSKSGQRIASQLRSIANKISNSNNKPKISLQIDYDNTLKTFQSQLNRVIKNVKLQNVGVKLDGSTSPDSKDNSSSNAYKKVYNELQKLQKLKIEYAKIKIPNQKDNFNYKKLISEQEQIVRNAKDIANTYKNYDTSKQREITVLEEKQNRQLEELINKKSILAGVDTNLFNVGGSGEGDLNKLSQQLYRVGEESKELKPELHSLKNKFQEIQSAIKADNDNGLDPSKNQKTIQMMKEYKTAYDQLAQSIKTKIPSATEKFATNNDINNLQRFINTLENFAKVNDKLFESQKHKNDYNKLLSEARNAMSTKDFDASKVKEFQYRLGALGSELDELNIKGQTFGTKFVSQFEKLGVYFSASSVIMGAVFQIKKMIDSVIELDSKITNIQMVTGGTREETAKLINSYSEMGQRLGATTVQVADSANEWLRQGKSIEDTNKLIEQSMILSKISGMTSAESTQYMTSAMKGYKVAVEDVASISDKVSKIDMVSATSAAGLMEGMSRTANFADDVGISMDKLLAMLATVGEVTQREMSTVGDSFKTIFARMSNIKLGKLIDDEDGSSLSDVETSLNNVGIKLRENETTFRNYGDVLDEVAGKWNSYNDVQKNSIATAFAGSRRIEDFRVLMSNYGNVLRYTEDSLESAGSAQKKFNDAYNGSIESKTNAFRASFEKMSNSLIDSTLVKTIIDLGTALTTVLGAFDGWIIKSAVILAGIMALKPAMAGLKTLFSKVFDVGILKNFITKIAGGISVLDEASIALTGASYAQLGFAAKTKLTTAAIWSNITALKAQAVALLSNPITWVVAGVAALGAAIYAIATRQDRLNKKMEESVEAYKKVKSEVEDVESQLDKIGKRIDEINSKDNISLTEQSELERLKEENRELETKLTLLQEQEKIKGKKANKDIDNDIKSDLNDGSERATYTYDNWGNKVYHRKDEETYYLEQVQRAQELLELGDKRTQQQQTELNNTKEYITEVAQKYQQAADAYVVFDEQTEQTKNKYKEMAYEAMKALNPSQWKINTIDDIFSRKEFKGVEKQLKELAKEGELSAEELEKAFGKDFTKALKKSGLELDDVVDYFNDVERAGKDTAKSVEYSADAMDNLSKNTKDIVSSASTLSDAFAEQNKNGGLSIDTLMGIVDAGYAAALTVDQQTGAIRLDEEATKALMLAKIQLQKADLIAMQSQIEGKIAQEGAQAVKSAQGFYILANAKAAAESGLATDVSSFNSLQTQISALDSVAANVGKVMSGKFSTGMKKASGGSGGAAKAADKHTKALEKQIDTLERHKDALQDDMDAMEDGLDAINDLLELVMDMLEQKYENQIDKLDELIDKTEDSYDKELDKLEKVNEAFNEKIDKQLESIRLQEEERQFQEELTEATKKVSDIRAKLDKAKLDNSKRGQQKQLQIEQELAEAQKELADLQHEHKLDMLEQELEDSKDMVNDAYDNKVDLIEKERDKRLESLEKQKQVIEKYTKLEMNIRLEAMELIRKGGQKLYNDLIAYNKKYGDGITANVKIKWEQAYSAISKYGSKNQSILSIQNQLTTAIYNSKKKIDEMSRSIDSAKGKMDKLKSSAGGVGSALGSAIGKANSLTAALGKVKDAQNKVNSTSSKKYHVKDSSGKIHTFSNLIDANQYAMSKQIPLTKVYSTAYAKGTKSAPYSSLANVDELGEELLIRNPAQGRHTYIEKGDGVVPADLTSRLISMASNPAKFIADKIGNEMSFLLGGNSGVNQVNVSYGNIVVNGNTDSGTVKTLESVLKSHSKELAETVFNEADKQRINMGYRKNIKNLL